MITSFYVINRQKINVDDLFVGSSKSIYWYTAGTNWRAPVAWACGVAPSMPGFISAVNPSVVVPRGCTRIYYINFLTGFLIASVLFVLLHRVFPARGVDSFVGSPVTRYNNILHFRNKWDHQAEVLIAQERRVIDEEEYAVMKTAHMV